MRIQRTTFLLTLTLKNSQDISIDAYGSNFEPLAVERLVNSNVETVNITTYMPNKIMLVISKGTDVELVDMCLAGIKIDNNILTNLIEYKPDLSGEPKSSIIKYLDGPSTRSRIWDQAGCVLFDFFHPNPFAYHMYIGNRIKF